MLSYQIRVRIFFLTSGLLALWSSSSISQAPLASINLSEWGISNPSDIRLAQFSLIQTPNGPLFNVQAVYAAGYFSHAAQRRPEGIGSLVLADFADPFINRFGGSYQVFQAGSSNAALIHDFSADGDRSVRLAYSRGVDGYCGFWMHTFNSAAPGNERIYFDAARFQYLMVSIKGFTGREQLLLKVADEAWNAKEDALPVGEIGRFLPTGRIDTTWQTAVIPVSAFPRRLNTSRLAAIAFEVVGTGPGIIEFSSLSFCTEATPPALAQSAPTTGSGARPGRALWVWNTNDLIRDQKELTALRSFVRDQSIDDIFLAIPYDPDHPEARKGAPIDQGKMARVVLALNASGVRVHALVGDKDFVKPEHRSFVRTTMQNIVRYQQEAEPAAQFYGIHLDIEPYLLPGFSSVRQAWFLQNLLEVFAECASLAHSDRLIIGADVPAWFDAPNELTNQRAEIHWNGTMKPVYQHIADMMDLVVLMDYRTGAAGEGGFVSQAANELRYAAGIQKRVMVGLETVPLLDETLFVIRGEPNTGEPAAKGTILCAISRGDSVLFTLLKNRSALAGLLKENQKTYADLLWWPISRETSVAATGLTFAQRDGLLKLRAAMQESEASLQLFPSFAGYSFHDYKGIRTLLGK